MYLPCPVCQFFTPVEDDSLLSDADQATVSKILLVEAIDDLIDSNSLGFMAIDYALALVQLLRPEIVTELEDGDEGDVDGLGGAPCQI